MKKFAVFDVDGTVIRWQLYHAVVDEFARRNYISPTDHNKIREARMVWKRRTSSTSFDEYEHEMVRLHDKALAGISYDEFMSAVQKVFDEYKDQTYTYTRDLIRSLKDQGYLLFAISASQAEIIKLLANYYGFDDYGGSVHELEHGHFTGNKQVLKRANKPVFLKQLIEKYGAGMQGSIAVGDSDSDIPLLETVEMPIAFNPNKLLFQHAKEQGWKIVIERKNMVYELEPKGGNYYLG